MDFLKKKKNQYTFPNYVACIIGNVDGIVILIFQPTMYNNKPRSAELCQGPIIEIQII